MRSIPNCLPISTERPGTRLGRLRVVNHENPLDKQIAATALVHDLTVTTRNMAHYASTGAHCASTGVRLLNPFV
jgi:hypothetical protein